MRYVEDQHVAYEHCIVHSRELLKQQKATSMLHHADRKKLEEAEVSSIALMSCRRASYSITTCSSCV